MPKSVVATGEFKNPNVVLINELSLKKREDPPTSNVESSSNNLKLGKDEVTKVHVIPILPQRYLGIIRQTLSFL